MIFNSYAQQNESLAGMHLVSCGHIFAKPGREIHRPKGREDFLLFYVAKGEETFYFDRAEQAAAGSFVLFAPGEKQHHAYRGAATAEFYYVHFRCDRLPDGIGLETSKIYRSAPSAAIVATFEEIIEETLEKLPHYEPLCLAKLLSLLALIQRETARTEAHAVLGHQRIARAIQHIGRYSEENLSLEDYAAMCCMSKYHFLRTFKEVTGVTPMEYRLRIRMENAKEMLEEGVLSVSEISEKVGFSSAAHFSDSFKKFVGISPKKFANK